MVIVCASTTFERDAFPATPHLTAHRFITGVGIPATFAGLAAALAHFSLPLPESTLILNIGIAGAYPETGIEIGDIVVAEGEVYGDVGFELPDAEGFRPLVDTPFGDFYRTPFPTLRSPEWWSPAVTGGAFHVLSARGCTVNTCTGTRATGERRRDRFGVGFETMEGAAVAQIAQSIRVPMCEIRAISNLASDRDMRPENIQLAVRNLRAYLETCVAARR